MIAFDKFELLLNWKLKIFDEITQFGFIKSSHVGLIKTSIDFEGQNCLWVHASIDDIEYAY